MDGPSVSPFAAVDAVPFGVETPDGSGRGSGHVGPSPSQTPHHSPSASLGLQLSLGEPSGRLSASLSRAGSLAARVAGGTGLRSSPTQELWRTSTAVSDLVASALGCVDVADLCGPSYVHPGRLKKIKALGEGAFAGACAPRAARCWPFRALPQVIIWVGAHVIGRVARSFWPYPRNLTTSAAHVAPCRG